MKRARWGAAVSLAAVTAVLAAAAAESRLTRAAVDRVVIGVVPQRELDAQDIVLMEGAGIGSVRVWFDWSGVERVRGDYSWSGLDQIVRTVSSSGLTVMPFLLGTPEWAAHSDGYDCEQFECIPYAPASTETRYAFARFAGAAVGRYGPGGIFWEQHPEVSYRPIGTWQIWNEPNLSSFYRPAVDATAYAAVLRPVAAAVRARDADAEIVLAGLSGTRTNTVRQSTRRYLRALYTVPAIADSFDGIAVHPYHSNARGVFEQIDAALAVAERHEGEVEMWITEIGWASAGKRRWGLVTDLSGQERKLRRVFTRFIANPGRWNLRGAYWYAWRDSERGHAVCGWCPAAGLVDRDGLTKPAYEQLRLLLG